MSPVLQSPSDIIGPGGQPTAVLLDWAARADLGTLARHERRAGWKSWADFEAELDARQAAGELPA